MPPPYLEPAGKDAREWARGEVFDNPSLDPNDLEFH